MRKVLSYVLVLALVLSSFSMAFAGTTTSTTTKLSDVAGITNEQAIQVAYNLGIVTGNPDGTYQPTKAVTRAEFAAMITRALAIPDSALAGYASTSFKDTTGYTWAVPYLAFCNSKGIMLGDGAGNAMPGKTITNNEAVTMALRAVGYTANSAKLVGTWPSNYVTLAQSEGLYDDVVKEAAGVDKANAAQIIYNLLTVGLVQVNSDGQTTELGKTVNGEFIATTLLTANHDASVRTEIVKYEDDAMINVIPYVGQVADVYRDGDSTNDPIIAIGDVETVSLTGNFTEEYADLSVGKEVSDLTTTNSGLVFEADDVEYTFAKDAMDAGLDDAWDGLNYVSFLNGAEKEIPGVGEEATSVTGDNFNDNTDFTINVKVQGKKIVAWASTESWVIKTQEQVDKGDLEDITTDQELLGYDFTTDKNDKIMDDSFELIGVTSLDKIAVDNIVYVYTEGNESDKEIRRVAVGTETVEGIVKSEDDGDFTINGKVYNNADDAKGELKSKNVGDTVKLYLDAYGDIYDFDLVKGSGSASDYAVVTKSNDKSGYDVILKMVTADGNEKQYVINDDIDSTLYNNLFTNPNTLAIGQIIAYGLDKNGEIDDLAATPAAVKDGFTDFGADAYLVSTKTLKDGSTSYVIDSDVVVFTYDGATMSAATDNDFDISKIADVETGSDKVFAKGAGAYFDEDGHIVALIVPEDSASNNNDTYAVINSKISTTNEDNDDVWQLKGFANGAAMDKITSSRSTARTPDSAFGTQVQLYEVTLDSDGVITKIEKVAGLDGATTYAKDLGAMVSDADDGYVVVTGGGMAVTPGAVLAISDKAAKYEVTWDGSDIDEYKTFSGSIKAGYEVWLFETDDDEDGYDVVIVDRNK